MDLLGALGVMARVVETGSFSGVARERELSQAAVARQVSQLEEHFGVRLFHRTTRKLSLTDDGEMLLGLARPVLDGVDGLEAALGRQSASPVGLVRVGVTVTARRFLAQRLPPLLGARRRAAGGGAASSLSVCRPCWRITLGSRSSLWSAIGSAT